MASNLASGAVEAVGVRAGSCFAGGRLGRPPSSRFSADFAPPRRESERRDDFPAQQLSAQWPGTSPAVRARRQERAPAVVRPAGRPNKRCAAAPAASKTWEKVGFSPKSGFNFTEVARRLTTTGSRAPRTPQRAGEAVGGRAGSCWGQRRRAGRGGGAELLPSSS